MAIRNMSAFRCLAMERTTNNTVISQPGLALLAVSFKERLLKQVLELVGLPPVALRLWDGTTVAPVEEPEYTLTFEDPRSLLGVLVNPELYFGDAYSSGSITLDGDLVGFLEAVSRGLHRASPPGLLRRLLWRWQGRARINNLSGSKENIQSHYDIGNAFYRLWLDEAAMQYTCAYYPSPDVDLETAQIAKLDHVCRKLRLKPGDTVVEAGSGWGGLALHMAKAYGAKVRSYNISHEQILYARERAEALGLSDRVEFVEDDYRNIDGRYDVFVSVGMLEHVGVYNYRALGEVIDRSLKPDGRGLIHTIGRNRARPMNPWIERRIFPGAYPPTLGEMTEIFEPRSFSILDVENIRLHYARTLEQWLERFEDNVGPITEMYDPDFVRAWRLYLAGSIASFRTGTLQLFQVVFTRHENNVIPWTRDYIYRAEEHKLSA